MADAADDFLEHFGIKGMKWGRRKAKPGTTRVVAGPGLLRARQATKANPHEDAINSAVTKARIAKSGLSSISNAELRRLNERMQLEQNYSNLMGQQKSAVDKGHNHVKNIMGFANTAQQVYGFYNSPLGKMLTAEVKQRVFSK